ncbi:MAG: ABC transporter ATP-binding protein [Alphaproteobacteria bacterium]|jgi:oligopeptide/dipeptide ABC transporter ATP-binding protein|nr:ABC transporter ATP-binding protein [Alphaproteobacteria bacterium]
MTATPGNHEAPILDVRGLRISIASDEGPAQVLDNVDLTIGPGRIVGVVGESGCGKSTVIRAVLAVLPRGAVVEHGSILFDGENLLELGPREMTRRIRGKEISFIPQDPYLALNPVFRIGTQLLEIMRWHAPRGAEGGSSRYDRAVRRRHREQLIELLRIVQVPDPDRALERYPHQFSGGQRQRLLIAGALACRPRLVIADEPTTALDVTTQLEILKLLRRLSNELDVSMLFVTHDFGVVAQLCDEVNVIYAGQSVETGATADILETPRHPYTQALIGCHPDRSEDLAGIPGAVPSPLAPPSGCRFHPRCASATAICRERRPERVWLGDGRSVDCVLYHETVGAASGD